MELLELLEAAAKSGFLALVLTLFALRYQTRQIEQMKREHEEEQDECRKRVERLTRALTEMHLWARSTGGGRRRVKLPDLTDLIDPDDGPAPTQH